MEQEAGDSWGRERLMEALDAFRRGVGEPPLLRKWTGAGPETGPVQPETGPVQKDGGPGPRLSFILSTDEVDRHGDVISPDGWDLESYRSNPVFLWAHDYARPVIGRALQTWTDSRRLMAQVEFAPTPFAQEVAALYAAGYQRGVSVGFKPLSYEERRQEKTGAVIGIRFLEQELLEASAVPVPANRNALRRALTEAPRAGEFLRRSGQGDSPAQEAWPLLTARVDELDKAVQEIARTLSVLDPGSDGAQVAGLADLLSVLKEGRL